MAHPARCDKRDYVKGAENFVFGRALHFTLRRLRVMFSRPAALVTLGAVSLALGISGPFGSYEHFALGPRLAYWVVMVFCTFAAGFAGGNFAASLLADRVGYFVSVPVIGVAAGVPVTLVVLTVTAFASPGFAVSPAWAAEMLVYCVAIATAVTAVFAAFRAGPSEAHPAHPTHRPPRLVARLPVAERGELISLSVSDHYVEVVTTRGRTLLLMRLSDAIAETDGVSGVQIHRSHWVALDRVRRIHRSGSRVTVETEAGGRLPVSRSFLPAVRAAGFVG